MTIKVTHYNFDGLVVEIFRRQELKGCPGGLVKRVDGTVAQVVLLSWLQFHSGSNIYLTLCLRREQLAPRY